MKIALAQINPVDGDLKANLDKHVDFVQRAIKEKADLIVFPELSLSGAKLGPDVADVSLSIEAGQIAKISKLSKKIDIVVGLNERSISSFYNRYNSAFYFSEGTLIHRHRKLFLVNYAVFEEGKHYVPGNNLQAFDTKHGRFCMLICNDLWHSPSPYFAALDGAELMIIPANSARDTLEHRLDIPTSWEHMNRAYGAMFGYFTVFVNRVGVRQDVYGEYPYWGGSEIIGPMGEEIVKAPYDQETMLYREIDIQRVSAQRYSAPVIRDARLWLYQQAIDRLAVKRSERVRLPEQGLSLAQSAEV